MAPSLEEAAQSELVLVSKQVLKMRTDEHPDAFFQPYRPREPITRFIECIWMARGRVAHKRERVLPNGVVELIVNLGSPHKVLDREDFSKQSVYKDCWVAGIQTRHLVIEAVRETDLVGIRFKPGGAPAFLRVPLAEITDQVIELDLIDRPLVTELRERVLEARSRAERLACVERVLARRLDESRQGHAAVQFMCRQIQAASGIVPIGDLVARAGLSHRRLMVHFGRDVGMTPKALAQIYKFQNALRHLRSFGVLAPDWGRIAAECGYYDQPHLYHEFKRLSGLTPSEYLATQLPDFNHTVAD
jgi:AraC-like DNA-binding protein